MTTDLPGAVAPRARGLDEVVVLDGSAVVYQAGSVHALNPPATLVWESCDGEVTLDGLADELALSFGVELADARRDVIGIAGELFARGLIEISGIPGTAGEEIVPVFQPSSACSGCGDGPTYERQLLVESGLVRLSVGADGATVDALGIAFGPHTVEVLEQPRDRASYGEVLPAAPRQSGVMELSRLHRGPDVLLTSRDPERILRALVAQVALHAVAPPQVRLDAVAVGDGARAVVMAAPAHRNAYAREAARHGLWLSDATAIVVDLESGTVIHGPEWQDLNRAPLARIAADRRHLGAEPDPLPWGRMKLIAIAVEGPADAGSVLGEMGGGVAWDQPTTLASVLDSARSVPVRTGVEPAQIAAWLQGR